MADIRTPHYHNTAGHRIIEISAREFMCIGAIPPYDHPHVFLDMGDDEEMVCPYCSTLYRFNPKLKAGTSKPDDCAWQPDSAQALA